MKRLLLVLVLMILCSLFLASTRAGAQNGTDPSSEPYTGQALCLPGAYFQDPQDCLPLGPSVYLTQLAKKGISYPFPPMVAVRRDPELNKVEFKYARVNVDPPDQAPIYSTLDDAISGNAPIQLMNPGRLLYVSYQDRADIDGAHFLFLRRNVWMRASPAEYNDFQGLIFKEKPLISPGWIVDQTRPRKAPGYDGPEIEETLIHGTLVQIFDIQKVQDVYWYMIGLNRWVERRFIRQVIYNPTVPAGVEGKRWIEINLLEQTLSVYENGDLLFATLIASGMKPYYTQPGLFKVSEKKQSETMSGAFEGDLSDYYYLEDVPWTMYFDKLRAIHGAYWRAMYGFPQSHGCVNMSVGDARWVFDWAQVGDWVYVHDPSGETPTDPKVYTEGGA
jgi:lipoprotein-anchoring transpeptidase ErfK/SrfK